MACVRIFLVSVLILWTAQGTSTLQDLNCPMPCSCFRNAISCRNKRIKVLPTGFTIGPSVETLDLSGNYFESIEQKDISIKGVYLVKSVYFNDSNVADISHNAFMNLTYMETLDLSENFLEQVPSRLIQYNKHMASLNLAKNLFRKTPELISESLEMLDLSQSQLMSFGERSVINLPNLRVLYLHQNNLKFISPNTFSLSHQLIYVELSYNNWRCNCSTARLFDNLIEKNLTRIDEPIRCRQPNRKFEDMYTKEGAVYAKKACGHVGGKPREADKIQGDIFKKTNTNQGDPGVKKLKLDSSYVENNTLEKENAEQSKLEDAKMETSTSEKLVRDDSPSTGDTLEIVSIVLVAVGLIVLTIVVVLLMKHRKKKEIYRMISSNSCEL